MSIESANSIKELVASNPTMADPVHEGPQHFAMLKRVLKTVFPGANGAGFEKPITATEDNLNNVAGLAVNIKAALDALVAPSKPATAGLNTFYPVGAIFTTTDSRNPATTMGFGTWERFAQGRVLVSVADGDPQFGAPADPNNPVGAQGTYAQGGSKASSLPAHAHGASLAVSGATDAAGTHAHVTDAQGSHAHGGFTNGMNAKNPHKHGQQLPWAARFMTGGSGKAVVPPHLVQLDSTDLYESRDEDINHLHGINADGTHAHNVPAGGNHQHAISGAANGNTAAAGVDASIGNLQPYIAVYMWRRTA